LRTIKAHFADRYIIAVRTATSIRKLFQIICGKNDGTLFITFPYYRKGCGRLGVVELDPSLTYPTNITVGDNFPVTSHYIKYSHHPSGKAHFSLTGKVKTLIMKESIPLCNANGHLFTIMIQGIDSFDSMLPEEPVTKKGLVAAFHFDKEPIIAMKFVGHYYTESELLRRFLHAENTTWTKCITPDGRVLIGIVLASTFIHGGERRYLLLTGERLDTICKDQEVFISFMGGFDHPNIIYDYNQKKIGRAHV
jgi:hypothetical protein